ncbi:hypothetical protein [Streptomyces naganishii]|uniref:hypothetical protein n=1 Tax=Streptomyces naganishii TaxID=285447 RepID=UPI001E460FA5|nr:hypothetical protein [Streptomyces naganishii]
MRYLPRRQRVCLRHGRRLLDADADQPLEHAHLRPLPEVVAAQRRWPDVARRASRAGVEPAQAFTLAHAVVARWWEQALYWEQEGVWPRRLHHLAGGNAGSPLEWWRIVGRDAATFPEVTAVARALLEPAMAEVTWRASGGMRPRARDAGDAFCHRLGERVGRTWLGPELAADHGSPLNDWKGAIVRARRHETGPPGWREDPWRLKRESSRPRWPASCASWRHKPSRAARGPGGRLR